MPEPWREGEENEGVPPSTVFFAHARPYPGGYVVDLHDVAEGEAQQWVMEWRVLPSDQPWTPHQAVEFFLNQALEKFTEFIGDRDLVLYFDCLGVDCHAPHTVTRAQLEESGFLQ